MVGVKGGRRGGRWGLLGGFGLTGQRQRHLVPPGFLLKTPPPPSTSLLSPTLTSPLTHPSLPCPPSFLLHLSFTLLSPPFVLHHVAPRFLPLARSLTFFFSFSFFFFNSPPPCSTVPLTSSDAHACSRASVWPITDTLRGGRRDGGMEGETEGHKSPRDAAVRAEWLPLKSSRAAS